MPLAEETTVPLKQEKGREISMPHFLPSRLPGSPVNSGSKRLKSPKTYPRILSRRPLSSFFFAPLNITAAALPTYSLA